MTQASPSRASFVEFVSHMETEREMERDRGKENGKVGEKEKEEYGVAA